MSEQEQGKVGFTGFGETWNGRLAMLGFVIGIATELMTGQGILAQLGLM
ncbi:MAG: high light inducible protein [Cyanobacteria bacterium P01_H01_bin.130]